MCMDVLPQSGCVILPTCRVARGCCSCTDPLCSAGAALQRVCWAWAWVRPGVYHQGGISCGCVGGSGHPLPCMGLFIVHGH